MNSILKDNKQTQNIYYTKSLYLTKPLSNVVILIGIKKIIQLALINSSL